MRITQVRRGGEEGAGEVGKRRGRSRLTSHITSKKDHSDLDLNNFILLQKERQKQIHICDLITSYQYQVTHTAKLALRWSGARAGAGRGLAIRLQPALERNAPTRWNQTVFRIAPKLFFLMAHPPQVADELIDAVKKGLGSRLACSLPLPDYSAGEVNIYVERLCNVQNTCFLHVPVQILLVIHVACCTWASTCELCIVCCVYYMC